MTSGYKVSTIRTYVGERLRRLLSRVSQREQIEVSGLRIEPADLLAPPIHPRVTQDGPVPTARLIIRAGRDGVIRSA